jgi:Ca2+ transporting ATPase
MLKNIIFQSVFQIIVLLVIVFAGELFIPEFPDDFDAVIGTNLNAKYYNGIVTGGTVRSGRDIFVNGDPDYKPIYEQYRVDSRHYTFVFNTFVMLQVFNFLNSRKLGDEVTLLINSAKCFFSHMQ